MYMYMQILKNAENCVREQKCRKLILIYDKDNNTWNVIG